MNFMKEALNDSGLRASRHKVNEWAADDQTAESSLLPTTMIGTRPTVTLTFSPRKRARQEAEYVAGLSILGKLHHRFFGFLRKQSD